jgi:anti-sigma B factor antagonist
MKIEKIEKYNAVILMLKGDMKGGEDSEKFAKLLKDIIFKNHKNVIADLSHVKYVNSSGIGILIRGLTTMRQAGGDLKLVNLTEKIRGLLSIVRLTQIFDIYDTIDEALGSYDKSIA